MISNDTKNSKQSRDKKQKKKLLGSKRVVKYGQSNPEMRNSNDLEQNNSEDYRYETPIKKMRKLGDSDNGAAKASEKNKLPIIASN
jgi:hypothetical protein